MKLLISTVATATTMAFLSISAPSTCYAGPVDVNIQLSGYLPAPPGVQIHFEAGRPYYVENNKRVYVKKKPKGDHGKKKGHGKKHRD